LGSFPGHNASGRIGKYYSQFWVEVVLKPYLTPKYGVVSFFEMLTYFRVCSAFSSTHALMMDVIWSFKILSDKMLSWKEAPNLLKERA
jgi:hypothetical protein